MKYKILFGLIVIFSLTGCTKISKEVAQKPKDFTPYYYLAVDKNSPDFKKEVVPAGSLILSCGDFITLENGTTIPYVSEVDNLTQLINQLLASSPSGMYTNPLKGSITLNNIKIEGELVSFYFNGKLPEYEDSCATAQAKFILEKTIEQNIAGKKYDVYFSEK